MTPIDFPRDDHPDGAGHPERSADERLSAQLAGLRPVPPGPGLRSRIAAELTVVEHGDSSTRSRYRRLGSLVERLAWAAGGAVAAALAFLVAGSPPAGREQAPVVAVAASGPAEPAARPPRVRDEAVRWSDEGIRFVDELTPARVLRRKVIERHMAGDGTAEVRVPREDVIFLPVALR